MYSVGHFKYRNSVFINDTALSKLPIMNKKNVVSVAWAILSANNPRFRVLPGGFIEKI